MAYFDVPEIEYTRYSNRQLAAVPLVVLAVALLVLSGSFLVYGTPVPLGMDFAGGTELTVQTTTPADEIPSAFDEQPESVTGTGSENQYIVQFSSTDSQALGDQAEEGLNSDGDSEVVQAVSSTSAKLRPAEPADGHAGNRYRVRRDERHRLFALPDVRPVDRGRHLGVFRPRNPAGVHAPGRDPSRSGRSPAC